MSFKILHRSSKSRARVGKIITEHGVFTTPVFMPPGTKGAVKAIAPDDLQKIEAEIILVNALHLFLRPGSGVLIRKLRLWAQLFPKKGSGLGLLLMGQSFSSLQKNL